MLRLPSSPTPPPHLNFPNFPVGLTPPPRTSSTKPDPSENTGAHKIHVSLRHSSLSVKTNMSPRMLKKVGAGGFLTPLADETAMLERQKPERAGEVQRQAQTIPRILGGHRKNKPSTELPPVWDEQASAPTMDRPTSAAASFAQQQQQPFKKGHRHSFSGSSVIHSMGSKANTFLRRMARSSSFRDLTEDAGELGGRSTRKCVKRWERAHSVDSRGICGTQTSRIINLVKMYTDGEIDGDTMVQELLKERAADPVVEPYSMSSASLRFVPGTGFFADGLDRLTHELCPEEPNHKSDHPRVQLNRNMQDVLQRFPYLEAMAQDESWMTDGLVAVMGDFFQTAAGDKREPLTAVQVQEYREERERLHAQIVTISQEFQKEVKFREGALHMRTLYASNHPISLQTSPSMESTANPKRKWSVRKKTKTHKKSIEVLKSEEAERERARAVAASNEALQTASTYITNLSSALQSLHDRYAYLTAELNRTMVQQWLTGMSQLWKKRRTEKLEMLRQMQMWKEGMLMGGKPGNPCWREVSQILCQELMRARPGIMENGNANEERDPVEGEQQGESPLQVSTDMAAQEHEGKEEIHAA